MAHRPHQLTTYGDESFANQVEAAAEDRDQSVSAFIREAVRRELQRENGNGVLE